MQANARLESRTTEDVEAGIQLLELATQLDPGYGRAWARLAEVQTYRAQYGTATFGEVALGIRTAAERAMAVAPDLAEAQLAHAQMLSVENAPLPDLEAAVQRALDLNPNSVRALLWLADIHESKMDEGARLRTMLAAVERDPLDVHLRRRIVDAYRDNGLEREADEALERAVAMDPDSVATRRLQAAALVGRGDVVGAVRILRDLLAENPEQLQLYMMLSRIYIRLGDTELGIAYMQRAWDIRPERVHDDLALVYLESGDREAFLRHWADYRAFSATEREGEDDLAGIDRLDAIVRQDWPRARELTEYRLQRARDDGYPVSVAQESVLLAGVANRQGDRATVTAAMTVVMRMVDRSASLGADYPYLDLIRAVDAAYRGDFDAAARSIARGMGDDPVFTILDASLFDSGLLPPPELMESAPFQALLADLMERRAAALAELHAAFPEPLL